MTECIPVARDGKGRFTRRQPPDEDSHSPRVHAENLGSGLVAALEMLYGAIRLRHPELPTHLVMVTGKPRTQSVRGHFGCNRWFGDEDKAHEMFISGAILNDADQVCTTMLHESAHALAAVRDITDTSIDGRYHNKRFKELAIEMGLAPPLKADHTQGYSNARLMESTRLDYGESIAVLRDAINLHRREATSDDAEPSPPTNRHGKMVCNCDPARIIRCSRTVAEEGEISCGMCESEFYLVDFLGERWKQTYKET